MAQRTIYLISCEKEVHFNIKLEAHFSIAILSTDTQGAVNTAFGSYELELHL